MICEDKYILTKSISRGAKRGEVMDFDVVREFMYGDIRKSDGYIFYAYRKKYQKYSECWRSPQSFEKSLQHDLIAAKEYRKNNIDVVRQRANNWVKKNRKKVTQTTKNCYHKNLEKYRGYIKNWQKNNPHKMSALHSRRRAAERNAIHPQHDNNDDRKLSKIRQIIRPVIDTDIDHIYPISRGGVHIIYNLRLLPKQLNNMKHNRLDSELTPDQQHECYFWRILTRVLTASYDDEKSA